MKTLSLIFLSLIISSAYSFETGKYRGETADGSQYCELDIIQNAKSHTINNLNCEDLNLGRSITAEPKEWPFGKTKQYFQEQKMTMTIEVAINLHKMNYSNKKKTESYDKVLTSKDAKTINYNFSITQEGKLNTWFDIDMKFLSH
jgi:hypothetical protein